MSTAASPKLWTIDEFLQRPPRTDGQSEELIEGEVYVSPNVFSEHTEIVRRLHIALRTLEQQGYVLLIDFACAFSSKLHSLPNPDLGVMLETEWKAAPRKGYVQNSPKLVIEVHPKSNRQLVRKGLVYLEHGAEQVWLVYPDSQRVRVLTQTDDFDVRRNESLSFNSCTVSLPTLFEF